MKVAEHYKDGQLYATAAMTDIGILLDDYEKSKAEKFSITDIVPMLHNIANSIDETLENLKDDNNEECDKIYTAIELLQKIAEDNSMFVRN
jgi:hypothetical protein